MPRSKEPPTVDWEALYKCPECEQVTAERRCDECNKFCYAIWAFTCPGCDEYITDEAFG